MDPCRGASRQKPTEAHLSRVNSVLQRETHPLSQMKRSRRSHTSDLVLNVGRDRSRLCGPRQDRGTLRRALSVRVDADAAAVVLADVAVAVAVAMVIVLAANVAVDPLLVGAGPLSRPDVSDWDEQGAELGTIEELTAVV